MEERPKALQPAPAPTAAKSSPAGFVIAFALLAGAVVAVLRNVDLDSLRPGATTGGASVASSASVSAPAPVVIPSGAAANPTATVSAAPSASAAPTSTPHDDDIPPGSVVPPGSGLLQIGAPATARVFVDSVDVGTGPLASSVQRAGYHQVRNEQDGKHSQYVIEVRPGKTTRVKSSPLP